MEQYALMAVGAVLFVIFMWRFNKIELHFDWGTLKTRFTGESVKTENVNQPVDGPPSPVASPPVLQDEQVK